MGILKKLFKKKKQYTSVMLNPKVFEEYKRIIITGVPGAGKTTFIKWLQGKSDLLKNYKHIEWIKDIIPEEKNAFYETHVIEKALIKELLNARDTIIIEIPKKYLEAPYLSNLAPFSMIYLGDWNGKEIYQYK